MLVSISKKFIFIEVPKTGSSSLTSALRGNVFSYDMRHFSAKKIPTLIGKSWHEYETWAVVRSTTDWLKSWYSFLSKSELKGLDRGLRVEGRSFDEFILNFIESLTTEPDSNDTKNNAQPIPACLHLSLDLKGLI